MDDEPDYLDDEFGQDDGLDLGGAVPLGGYGMRRGIPRTPGMSLADPSSDERLDEILGLEAPEYDDGSDDPGFDVDPLDEFLERLSQGGVPQGLQKPRGFFQGLVSGAAQGAVGRGQRVGERRKKFEASQTQRAAERDRANAQATRDYRTQRAAGQRDLGRENRAERRTQQAYERDNPTVTPADAQAQPELARLVGKPVPRAWLKPESAAEAARAARQDAAANRMEASGQRAEAAGMRAESAATRAISQAQFQNESKLVDDYRLDPSVKGYQNVRTNLVAAREAAKLKSGFGDKAIIFAYARALEPDAPNAVREGEYASARQGAGAFEALKNLPRKYFKGNDLSDVGRREILQTLESLAKSRRKGFDESNQRFRKRAKGGGVDESVFLTEYPEDLVPEEPKTRMRAPDGRVKLIPASQVRAAIAGGGTVVQ